MPSAEVLMITSRCSAGCRPCPFGTSQVPSRYLGVDAILTRMAISTAPLIVITGGEPLEHPQFEFLLQRLSASEDKQRPFRIATGGHHPLNRVLEILAPPRGFEGISLGTDVLGSICPQREKFIPIWRANVERLNATHTPYSLTLTLHGTREESQQILSTAADLGAQPEFLYLRVLPGDNNSHEIKRFIQKIWPGLEVIEDRL